MKIYLIDQTNYLQQHLKNLQQISVMPYAKENIKEKITTITINTATPFAKFNLQFLFDYAIFPKKIMTYLTQWSFENRAMQVGDTIVQQVFLPPFGSLSQKIIFGVRIKDIIDEPNRKGFSYETLKGHLEKGLSVFTVEETADNKLIFKIQTFSKPGHILSQLGGPFIAVPYQSYCTRLALNHVKQQLEK